MVLLGRLGVGLGIGLVFSVRVSIKLLVLQFIHSIDGVTVRRTGPSTNHLTYNIAQLMSRYETRVIAESSRFK